MPGMDHKREVWLLRHGATEWSKNGRHTGRTDIALLQEGEEQAAALAPCLAGRKFARVLVSPALRARRTCELAGLLDKAEVTDDLWEWNYGDYEGLTSHEIHAKRADWDMWEHGYPGGEDSAAVTVRCQRVVDICRVVHGDVALFAHGHILRSLAAVWLGLGADKVNRITCKNHNSSLAHAHLAGKVLGSFYRDGQRSRL